MLLTPDAGRMRRALVEVRGEESAWPDHQYLWRLHPIFSWLADRTRGLFGRHAAPILVVPPERIEQDHAVALVSGVLPNRRAQSLVQAWAAIRFGPEGVPREPFEPWLTRTRFGREPLPNPSWAPEEVRLRGHVHAAVAEAEARRVRGHPAPGQSD